MLTFAIGFALVAEVHLARKDFDACLKNLFFALNAVQALQNLEHSRQLTDAMIDEGVRVEQMKLDLDEIENLISIFKMDCMPDAQVFTWMREKYNAIQADLDERALRRSVGDA